MLNEPSKMLNVMNLSNFFEKNDQLGPLFVYFHSFQAEIVQK